MKEPSIGITFLGSGSKGNSALLNVNGAFFLLDAGLSFRRIERHLTELGVGLSDLRGILLTHGHGDHVKGLKTLLKHAPIPVYATTGTFRELHDYGIPKGTFEAFPRGGEFELMGVRFWPFSVPHDAIEPIGFRLEKRGISMAIATDIGHITPEAMHFLTDVDILCLESNYDDRRLAACSYPPWLKTRIKGPLGHLSNIGVRGVLSRMKRAVKHLTLVHVSQESNLPELVLDNVQPLLSLEKLRDASVVVASQDRPTSTMFCVCE